MKRLPRLTGIRRLGMSSGGAAAPTTLTLTCTTTGAQTLFLQGVTVAASKTVTVDWGDTTSNTYTAGAGTRSHAYGGAGVWTVVIHDTPNITLLDLRDTKISCTITAANPLPANLTSLYIDSLTGLTYNVNNAPLPAGLITLKLIRLPGITYNVNNAPLPSGITTLDLRDMNGLTYNANTNPLPAGLLTLILMSLTGLTYNANTNPLPAGLTSIYLNALPRLTWQINAAQPWPTGATAAVVTGCPNVTVSAWTDNAIRTAQFENAWNQAAVDACVNAFLANKANFTWTTPSLDILGGSNAAPSGIYQAADPVTSGKEAVYALMNGNGSYAPGPEWTVQYPA